MQCYRSGVNFFGHAVVASWRSDDPAHAFGAMLPDFATMSGGRVRAVQHAATAAGVELHHRSDAAFHRAPTFRRLYRDGTRALGDRGVGRGGALGAAHIGVELLLDGALVADPAAGALYESALRAAADPTIDDAIEWREPEHAAKWRALRARLNAHGVPHGYADASVVAERVTWILARRPRLALDATGEHIVAEWLREVRDEVHAAAPAMLGEVRDALAA